MPLRYGGDAALKKLDTITRTPGLTGKVIENNIICFPHIQ
jgi:hypothetical protein